MKDQVAARAYRERNGSHAESKLHFPPEPLVSNDETIEAIKAARRGELVTVGAAENLLGKLNARD